MKISEWHTGQQLWDLLNCLRASGALGSGTIFRGHANADWKLVPALYRREVQIGGPYSKEELYLTAERGMLDTFFDRGLLLLPQFDRNDLLDRVIAQHYGVPTQLLDWTLDPLIGLFFVVSDEGEANTDGALYYASVMRGVSSRSRVSFPFSGQLATLIPPVLDERVRMQKSVFTLQSFGSPDAFVPLDDRELKLSQAGEGTHPSDEVEAFGKVVIPAQNKLQILDELMQIGIDTSLMFPGLQGIGERIAAHARIKNYGGNGRF